MYAKGAMMGRYMFAWLWKEWAFWIHTVDGSDPAQPPGMVRIKPVVKIMVDFIYQPQLVFSPDF